MVLHSGVHIGEHCLLGQGVQLGPDLDVPDFTNFSLHPPSTQRDDEDADDDADDAEQSGSDGAVLARMSGLPIGAQRTARRMLARRARASSGLCPPISPGARRSNGVGSRRTQPCITIAGVAKQSSVLSAGNESDSEDDVSLGGDSDASSESDGDALTSVHGLLCAAAAHGCMQRSTTRCLI